MNTQTARHYGTLSPDQRYQLLCELTEIAIHSDVLREIELRHLPEVFLRPYDLGQFRRWRRNGEIIGVASWAWLNDDTA